MASESRAMLFLLLLSAMAIAASAEVFPVGGASGWGLGSQSGVPILKPGDIIHFRYQQGVHNVAQVSHEDYINCEGSRAHKTYVSGDDYITLPSAGGYYFICSISGHCSTGMKLFVDVQRR